MKVSRGVRVKVVSEMCAHHDVGKRVSVRLLSEGCQRSDERFRRDAGAAARSCYARAFALHQ